MLNIAKKVDQLMDRYQITLDQAITCFKHPNLWTLNADRAFYFNKHFYSNNESLNTSTLLSSLLKAFCLSNGSLNSSKLLHLPNEIYVKILSFIAPGFTQNLFLKLLLFNSILILDHREYQKFPVFNITKTKIEQIKEAFKLKALTLIENFKPLPAFTIIKALERCASTKTANYYCYLYGTTPDTSLFFMEYAQQYAIKNGVKITGSVHPRRGH